MRRFVIACAAVLGLANQVAAAPDRHITLLPQQTIASAITAVTTDAVMLPAGAEYLAVEAKFVYGADGTTAKAWVQTSLDGGITWIDIMCFAFATTTASKVSAVVATTALAAGVTPTDGTLSDNAILSGLLGDRVRLKITTTGTYSGTTHLTVVAVGR
jgi:hypothetical protein